MRKKTTQKGKKGRVSKQIVPYTNNSLVHRKVKHVFSAFTKTFKHYFLAY